MNPDLWGPGLPVSEDERNRRLREFRAQRNEAREQAGYVEAMQTPRPVGPNDPFVDPSQDEPEEEDASLLGSVGAAISNTGKAVVRGAAKAVDETASFFTFGRYRPIGEENMPEVDSDHAAYGFIEGAAQFGVGMVGAGKLLKPIQLGRRAYRAARGAGIGKTVSRAAAVAVPVEAAGVITDFVAFDPYEARIADWMATADNNVVSAVGDFWSADEDDGQLEARAKAAVEGAMVGLALGSTIAVGWRMIKLSGIHKQFKRGAVDAAEAQRRADLVKDAPYTNDDAVAIFHGRHEQVIVVRNRADLELNPRPFLDFDPALEAAQRMVDEDELGIDEYMWHAGTRGKEILQSGLKSRRQLDTQGLGGGPDHTISVTYSREHAENISGMQRLVTRIAKGDANADEVIDHFAVAWEEGTRDRVEAAVHSMGDIFDTDALRRMRGAIPANDDEAFESFMKERGIDDPASLHPSELEKLEIEFEEVSGTNYGDPLGDPDDFAEIFEKELAKLSPEDQTRALAKLAINLDLNDGEWMRRTAIVGNTDDIIASFKKYNEEDLQIFQVGAHKDVTPLGRYDFNVPDHGGRSQTVDHEYELRFHPDDVELLERIVARNEQQAAAMDWMIRYRDGSARSLDPKKIQAAAEIIERRLASGAAPDDPLLYADIGLNLGLFVKTTPDFARVSGSVAKALKELHGESRFDPKVAPKTWEELEERSLAEFKRIFGEGATMQDLRAWADDLGSTSLDNAQVMLDAGMKVLNVMAVDISRVARAYDLIQGAEKVGLQDLLEDMVDTFAHIQLRVLGGRSEAGRILNSLKKAGQEPSKLRAVDAHDAIQAGKTERQRLTTAQALELARNLRLADGDAELVRKILAHTADIHKGWDKDPRLMDKINWFRTGMLLSGPKTFAINLINNAFTAFQVPVEHFWAGMRSGDKALRQFGQDELAGAMAHVMDAWRMSRRTWKENSNVLDPTYRTDEDVMLGGPSPLTKIGSMAKTMVDVPGRALMSTDEFFKQLNYRNHVRAQALMMAREDLTARGIKVGTKEYRETLAQRVGEAMDGAFSDAGHALNPTALEHARYTTFTNQLGDDTIGGGVKNFANKHPSLRFIMPFIRTPINLFRFAWQRTPVLGRLQHQMREDLAAGGHRRAIAEARLEAGWALWGTGAALVMGNKITGGGPSEPRLRKQWMDLGNQPYSIRLPDGSQISYNRLEPLATAIGIIADAAEAAGELDEENGAQVAYAVMSGIASSVTSKTFLTGLSDFLGAVEEGDPWKVRRFVSNASTSFSPNFLNQINADEAYREARGIVDEYRKKLPGFSETLEPRRNLFGEPVLKPPMAFGMDFPVGNWANNSLNPFTTMKVSEDWETFQALTELGKALPYPNRYREERNIDLADRKKWDNGTGQSPFDRMFEIVSNPPWGAPPLRDELRRLVESEDFAMLRGGSETFKGGGRHEIARRVVRAYYTAAEKQVIQEYPKLQEEMMRLMEVKIEGMVAEPEGQLERDQSLWR